MKKVLISFEYGQSFATLLAGDDIEERWSAIENMEPLWADDMQNFTKKSEQLTFHTRIPSLMGYDYKAHVHMNENSILIRLSDGFEIVHKGAKESEK